MCVCVCVIILCPPPPPHTHKLPHHSSDEEVGVVCVLYVCVSALKLLVYEA